MNYYVIFAEKDRIIAIDEADVGYYRFSSCTVFLMVVKAKRMGKGTLKRIIEEKFGLKKPKCYLDLRRNCFQPHLANVCRNNMFLCEEMKPIRGEFHHLLRTAKWHRDYREGKL